VHVVDFVSLVSCVSYLILDRVGSLLSFKHKIMYFMLPRSVLLLLCLQASFEKETQLRQQLEERLSKESLSTDRLRKELAAAKVLKVFCLGF